MADPPVQLTTNGSTSNDPSHPGPLGALVVADDLLRRQFPLGAPTEEEVRGGMSIAYESKAEAVEVAQREEWASHELSGELGPRQSARRSPRSVERGDDGHCW